MKTQSKSIVGGAVAMIISCIFTFVVFAYVYNSIQFDDPAILSSKRHVYIGPDDGAGMAASLGALLVFCATAVPSAFITAYGCSKSERSVVMTVFGTFGIGIVLSVVCVALVVSIMMLCPLYPAAQ